MTMHDYGGPVHVERHYPNGDTGPPLFALAGLTVVELGALTSAVAAADSSVLAASLAVLRESLRSIAEIERAEQWKARARSVISHAFQVAPTDAEIHAAAERLWAQAVTALRP